MRGRAADLALRSRKVRAMASYDRDSRYGIYLRVEELVFKMRDPALISKMISSMDLSVARNCNEMFGIPNAGVYLEFEDGSVGAYMIMCGHIYADGLFGTCYFISPAGQILFESKLR
jgi:hypothetical protein